MQRDGVSLAIYNQGTALVQDRRTFTFQEGLNTINFTDVAAGIDPTSVTFVSLTDPNGTVVLEQNYVYDLVNSAALVQRYIDQQITVITTDGTEYNGHAAERQQRRHHSAPGRRSGDRRSARLTSATCASPNCPAA